MDGHFEIQNCYATSFVFSHRGGVLPKSPLRLTIRFLRQCGAKHGNWGKTAVKQLRRWSVVGQSEHLKLPRLLPSTGEGVSGVSCLAFTGGDQRPGSTWSLGLSLLSSREPWRPIVKPCAYSLHGMVNPKTQLQQLTIQPFKCGFLFPYSELPTRLRFTSTHLNRTERQTSERCALHCLDYLGRHDLVWACLAFKHKSACARGTKYNAQHPTGISEPPGN
jgi:hypothetical protein